ncbi:transglycosylase SLT domain-containing protein [Candidatus Woesearchaeota archaeon]|nr:transglycosylase SLT domain-containing protein [Candidatus Woesearchaeota archaeon]
MARTTPKTSPNKTIGGKIWDNVKFPFLVAAGATTGILLNEFYFIPNIIADNAGIIQKKIGEWGYAALPWTERIVVNGIALTSAYRTLENMVREDTKPWRERTRQWKNRAIIIGALATAVTASIPYIVPYIRGERPATYVSKKPTDMQAERIKRDRITYWEILQTSNQVEYSEEFYQIVQEGNRRVKKKVTKPVTYRESLVNRVRGAMSHADIHQKAYKTALAQYPDLKNYPEFNPNLTIALEAQESGGNNNLRSRAGAEGVMQFMPGTGREEGLSRAELRDPRRAIPAAVNLLARYAIEFDSVPTALAAYNHGVNGTRRKTKRQDTTNYWRIEQDFPSETQKYVPRVLATANLIQDPDKYRLSFSFPTQAAR